MGNRGGGMSRAMTKALFIMKVIKVKEERTLKSVRKGRASGRQGMGLQTVGMKILGVRIIRRGR